MHLDTGLFVNFGASATGDGLVDGTTRYRDTGVDDQELFYSGQAGIERPFLALGKTTIYADYYTYNGGASTPLLVGPGDPLNPTGLGQWAVWRSDVNIWGGGIAQGIDSAGDDPLPDVSPCLRRSGSAAAQWRRCQRGHRRRTNR